VRSRSPLFKQIIAALKARACPSPASTAAI
jgi:hypothetical protein